MSNSLNRRSYMIGSMPQATAEGAYAILDKYPLSIPTWAQLPKASYKEAMIPQYSEGFPGITYDDINKSIWVERNDDLLNKMAETYEHIINGNSEAFSISADFAAGLHAFLKKLENEGKKYPFLKGQVTGPFTFGLGLNDNNKKAIYFDPQYKDIVLKGLTMKALWLADKLKPYTDQVLISLDEPILSALGTPAYIGIQDEDVIDGLNEIIDSLHEKNILTAVHCCGNMDWGLLARTNVDIISFDAYSIGDKVALYPEDINNFLDRNGHLAFGIVPTDSSEQLKKETTETLQSKINELFEIFKNKSINIEKLKNQMTYSPSCGIGSLPVADSEIVLELLKEISE